MTALALATALGAALASIDLVAWGFLALLRLFGTVAR